MPSLVLEVKKIIILKIIKDCRKIGLNNSF